MSFETTRIWLHFNFNFAVFSQSQKTFSLRRTIYEKNLRTNFSYSLSYKLRLCFLPDCLENPTNKQYQLEKQSSSAPFFAETSYYFRYSFPIGTKKRQFRHLPIRNSSLQVSIDAFSGFILKFTLHKLMENSFSSLN